MVVEGCISSLLDPGAEKSELLTGTTGTTKRILATTCQPGWSLIGAKSIRSTSIPKESPHKDRLLHYAYWHQLRLAKIQDQHSCNHYHATMSPILFVLEKENLFPFAFSLCINKKTLRVSHHHRIFLFCFPHFPDRSPVKPHSPKIGDRREGCGADTWKTAENEIRI